MSAPNIPPAVAPPANLGWWLTTLLGVVGSILAPLAANCTFGPSVCPILVAASSAIALLLGWTHSGTNIMPPKG